MKLLDSIEGLREGLNYHLARHNLLTSNMAHVDTPGYKPLELYRTHAFEKTLNVELQKTDSRHLGVSTVTDPNRNFDVKIDPTAVPGLDGNAVNIDREAVKLASNSIRYDALTTRISGMIGGMLWAVTDGKGA